MARMNKQNTDFVEPIFVDKDSSLALTDAAGNTCHVLKS